MSITIRPKDTREILGKLPIGTFVEWDEAVHMVVFGQPHQLCSGIIQIDTKAERTLFYGTKVRVVHLVEAIFE